MPPPAHEIDHIDGDPTNEGTHYSNLRLLCWRCNRPGRPKRQAVENGGATEPQIGQTTTDSHVRQIQKGTPGATGSLPKRERENITPIIRSAINLQEGSTETKLSDIYEGRWIVWIESVLDRDGFIPKAEAINAGAFVSGAETPTTRRYLDKHCNSEGPYVEVKDPVLRTAIIMRKATLRSDALITVAAASRQFSLPESTLRRARDKGIIGSVGGKLYEDDTAAYASKRKGEQQ